MTRSRTILIVDDSELTRTVLAARLKESGASVVCATSATEALAVDAEHITAAIVDVELGTDDGVSLADVLEGRNPRLRLALFTAHEAEHARKTFRKPDQLDSVIAWALDEKP